MYIKEEDDDGDGAGLVWVHTCIKWMNEWMNDFTSTFQCFMHDWMKVMYICKWPLYV